MPPRRNRRNIEAPAPAIAEEESRPAKRGRKGKKKTTTPVAPTDSDVSSAEQTGVEPLQEFMAQLPALISTAVTEGLRVAGIGILADPPLPEQLDPVEVNATPISGVDGAIRSVVDSITGCLITTDNCTEGEMVCNRKITDAQRSLAWFLRIYRNASYREIARECGISKSSVARICHHNPASRKKITESSTSRGGRPRKVSQRSVRKLVRTLKELRTTNLHLTVKNIVERSGLSFHMASRRTFSRYLNENGYEYLQARKKGLLSENDRKLRVRFARKMKRIVAENPNFWTNEVAFYLDAVSFVHKYNPQSGASVNRSRVWRQKGEGLKLTSKGSKDLAGGRRLHVLVAIAYSKGVILNVPYEKMNGNFFAEFIRTNFNIIFGRAGPKRSGRRLFMMDNDPSQRSKPAKKALEDIEAELLELPPRCADIHCIENLFNFVKRYLEEEAVEQNITKESFDQFTRRVLRAFNNNNNNNNLY